MSVTLPKISIVMPVLNREDTVEKAIRSVIEQQYDNIEFIIFDGGSKDQTIDIIKRYEKHITYWHSQPDGGAALATNAGIEKATGDLVAIFMADDWFEPGTFQKIGEAYLANPNADMFTCAGRIVRYNQEKQAYEALQAYTKASQLELNFYNICFAVSAICCRFIKKSFYDKIGLYIPLDTNGKQILTNDKEFLLRAVLAQAKDVFVDHLGHTYLAHQGSFSFSNSHKNMMRHCEEHMDIATNYLQRADLTFKQRLFFTYWYHDQSARLVLFKLFSREYSQAFSVAKTSLKKAKLLWPTVFAYTICRVCVKRSLALMRK